LFECIALLPNGRALDVHADLVEVYLELIANLNGEEKQ